MIMNTSNGLKYTRTSSDKQVGKESGKKGGKKKGRDYSLMLQI